MIDKIPKVRRTEQTFDVVIGDGKPVEQNDKETHIFTDGSGLEDRYGAAAVIKWSDGNKSVMKGLGESSSVFPG